MRKLIDKLLCRYYIWRCNRTAKKKGIIEFHASIMSWDGIKWRFKTYKELLVILKEPKEKYGSPIDFEDVEVLGKYSPSKEIL